jgi:myo-inositol-1(or 4)-monophosphatase
MKGMGDYVTDLDRRSEEAIIQKIKAHFPDHIIHAEESGVDSRDSKYRWIIDPLDGTANYVQGIPVYGISIALLREGNIVLGVVYHPERDELYWAERGRGAYLNGEAVTVSDQEDIAYSMIASGFPWRSKEFLDPYLATFKEMFLAAAGMRRMGAAAIDLAYTACGRFDGFWEMKLGPWDVAAGILLVEEAGGIVTDFTGQRNFLESGNVVAGNPKIHPTLLRVVQDHLSSIG